MKRPTIAAIALLGLIGTAYALNPPLKEGYWTVHMVTVSQPGNKTMDGKYFICRNHAYDAYVEGRAQQPGCVIKSKVAQSNHFASTVSCVVGGTTINTSSVASFSGDTSSHTETSSTYSPAFMGMTAQKMTIDFAYVGSCPAGVQPGDRVNQNGSITHLWSH